MGHNCFVFHKCRLWWIFNFLSARLLFHSFDHSRTGVRPGCPESRGSVPGDLESHAPHEPRLPQPERPLLWFQCTRTEETQSLLSPAEAGHHHHPADDPRSSFGRFSVNFVVDDLLPRCEFASNLSLLNKKRRCLSWWMLSENGNLIFYAAPGRGTRLNTVTAWSFVFGNPQFICGPHKFKNDPILIHRDAVKTVSDICPNRRQPLRYFWTICVFNNIKKYNHLEN